MSIRGVISFSLFFFFLDQAPVPAQEIVKGSEKNGYVSAKISRDNGKIVALSSDDPLRSKEYLVVFNRQRKSKHVLWNVKDGGLPVSVAFSSFGSDFQEILAGGSSFFAGWEADTLRSNFLHRGSPDINRCVDILRLTVPKRGDKLAYMEMHTDTFRQRVQTRLVVWDRFTGEKDVVQTLAKKGLGFLTFQPVLSNSGKVLAHWNSETKEIVVHDLSKRPFKEMVAFDIKPNYGLMAFTPDEKSLWIRVGRKAKFFDIATKKLIRSIDLGEYAGWFHVLSDSSDLMIYEEREKKTPIVRFIEAKGKSDKRFELEHKIHWLCTKFADLVGVALTC
jgi:hypothetical protein